MRWQVVSNRSVRVGDRTLMPGSEVPEGVLTESQCLSLAKRGFLVPAVPAAEPEPVKPVVNRTITTPWTLNPEDLLTLDLETLNVMIAERDASVAPFDNAEEAVYWLSQDYHGG